MRKRKSFRVVPVCFLAVGAMQADRSSQKLQSEGTEAYRSVLDPNGIQVEYGMMD